jgi:hypothetical protein
VVEGLSSLTGMMLYNLFLRGVSYRRILYWTIVFGMIAGLTPLILILRLNEDLGISDRWFAATDSALLAGVGQVGLMPLLILGAQTCPKNVEGTLYSVLMSTLNIGGVLADQLGGLLTWALGVTSHDFKNLWLLVLCCQAFVIVTIPLLYFWVPEDEELAVEMKKAELEEAELAKQMAGEAGAGASAGGEVPPSGST